VWRRALSCVAEQDRRELNLRTLKAAEADDFMPSPAVLHVDKDYIRHRLRCRRRLPPDNPD